MGDSIIAMKRSIFEMKKWVIAIIVFLLTTSCQFNSMKIIHHERPNIETDFSPFQNIGCAKTDENDKLYQCEENSPLFVIGCDFVEEVPLLGGLTPNYPTARCTQETDEEFAFVVLPPDECLYANGFMTTFCNRYLIYKDNDFQLIKTMDEFRTLFAPIDSPNEALGFVLARGRYTAKYNQTESSKHVYMVQELEDTYIETTTDGYIVHVFYAPLFGCGVFETSAVGVKVTHDGQIEEITRHIIYQTKESICVE
jgi:hypothetical protein